VVEATDTTKSELFSKQAVLENEPKEAAPVDAQSSQGSSQENGYSDVAGSPKKELIVDAIRQAMDSGRKPNLSAISRELGVSYSYVKDVAKEMKQERTTADDMPALQVVK
jgi:hypothetical protein